MPKRIFKRRYGTKKYHKSGKRPLSFSASRFTTAGRRHSGMTEIKNFCSAITPGTLTQNTLSYTTPSAAFNGYTHLNNILMGSAYYNRIGAKILMKSIKLDISIYPNNSGTAYPVRIMLVYDASPNGSAPPWTVILYSGGAETTSFGSSVATPVVNRFKIIWDKKTTVGGVDTTIKHFSIFKRCYLPCTYQANAGTIGDISTGSVYLLCWYGLGSGSANLYATNIHSKITYID